MNNEEIIDQIVTTAIEIATEKAAELAEYSETIRVETQTMASGPPASWYDYGFSPEASEPPINIPVTLDNGGVDMAVYDSVYNRMMSDVPLQLANFLLTYFPNDAAYLAAIEWAENQLANGGSGINPLIEAQIVARDRDRIATEAARARTKTLTDSAARGFPIPSGAATYALCEINRAGMTEMARSSREVAIKQMEMEFEAVKEALTLAYQSKKGAMDAALGYVTNIMRSGDNAAALARTNADAQASLINAAANMYSTRIEADKLMHDYRYKVKALNVEGERYPAAYNQAAITARAAAMADTARALGANAAAAISSLNAIGHSTSSS